MLPVPIYTKKDDYIEKRPASQYSHLFAYIVDIDEQDREFMRDNASSSHRYYRHHTFQ